MGTEGLGVDPSVSASQPSCFNFVRSLVGWICAMSLVALSNDGPSSLLVNVPGQADAERETQAYVSASEQKRRRGDKRE